MSLYKKIGGQDAVNAAVDIFYRKVLNDPIVCNFFDDVDMDKQIAKQKSFLTVAFGGPNNYEGQNMRDAHKHMDLHEEHFQAVAGHLQATLEDLNVPVELISQVMEIAGSTHDDVLNI